jgi:prephenate dehydratase
MKYIPALVTKLHQRHYGTLECQVGIIPIENRVAGDLKSTLDHGLAGGCFILLEQTAL